MHIYNKQTGNRELLKYNTNDFSKVFGWNYDEVNSFFRKYYLDALKEIEPKFNVKEVLTKLKNEGHEIIFITIRNDNECGGENKAYRMTAEWFKKHAIPYDELHIGISNKKVFCLKNNIDVFMDDSEKNCLEVSELGIKTFIAMNSFNLGFKDENIINIYNMNEFYDEMQKLQI